MNFSEMESENSTTTNAPFLFTIIPIPVRFWIYLIADILSVLCSLFVLYYLLFDRILRQALNNHVIIVLLLAGLIYELTTVPLMLYYFQFYDTWQISATFSRFWSFIDYTCYTTQMIGIAWASIERHILIFNSTWLVTQRKRFLWHYLPLIIICIYCIAFETVYVLYPWCGDTYGYSPINGVPVHCPYVDPEMALWDTFLHQIIPTVTVIVFSLALLFRVLKQQAQFRRSTNGSKHRKLTIQLLSITSVYLLFNFPRSIIQIFIFTGSPTNELQDAYYSNLFFSVCIVFFLPFICYGSTPGLNQKLNKLFCHANRLHPTIVPENELVQRT